MSKIIEIGHRYKDFISKDNFCIVCSKELKGSRKRADIPTGRKPNEHIVIASCNACYYKTVKKHMNDFNYWASLYEDKGIFEDLPPIKDIN